MNKEKYRKAVIIPIYKEMVTNYEAISIQQCMRILGEYSIIFVCPNLLNTATYEELTAANQIAFRVERFDDTFFKGITGYNSMMLNKSFYERFVNYDRILIYQADCFVFKNEFDYFCKYDYVGAPWIYKPNNLDSLLWVRKLMLNFRRIAKKILKKDNQQNTVEFKVGNGGFSLRNPKKFVEIIAKFEQNKLIENYRNPRSHFYCEDVFWGCEVNALYPNLRVAPIREALNFSLEMHPSSCFRANDFKLPFGCHAWAKYDIEFWKPHIKKFGYNL